MSRTCYGSVEAYFGNCMLEQQCRMTFCGSRVRLLSKENFDLGIVWSSGVDVAREPLITSIRGSNGNRRIRACNPWIKCIHESCVSYRLLHPRTRFREFFERRGVAFTHASKIQHFGHTCHAILPSFVPLDSSFMSRSRFSLKVMVALLKETSAVSNYPHVRPFWLLFAAFYIFHGKRMLFFDSLKRKRNMLMPLSGAFDVSRSIQASLTHFFYLHCYNISYLTPPHLSQGWLNSSTFKRSR